MPYISSSIIMQLMTVVSPRLHELQKEGEQGRKKFTQYTRYGTVLLCLVQGYMTSTFLSSSQDPKVVISPGIGFTVMTIITLTAGTIFLMWLGEQITERGIGNGISLIIFAGIAASIPSGIASTWKLYQVGDATLLKIALLGLVIAVTFFVIIFVERAARRVPVQYAKRIVGRKVYGGQNTHLPLKVNVSGVIPPIFASSIMLFPATIATFVPWKPLEKISQLLSQGQLIYNILFGALIVFFCFFYTQVTFKTDDVAENLKKYGGFIPGIRPGPPTANYLNYVLDRVTAGGAAYITAICLIPTFLVNEYLKFPFYFGGTSVLILVGVALDTVSQIETFLLSRNYEGFMRHARIKGRRTAYS